jgi:two-component system, chemotaxis family, chemotaxis protein CheY
MKILIVDDDRIIRLLLRNVLQELPQADVIDAADGLEAWDKLERGLKPDLAITDMMMPRMDGVELIQKIRSNLNLRGLRIIMCTVINDRYRMAEALSLDISGYVVKPFTPSKLLEEARRVLKPANNSDLLSTQAEARSRMIIGYYIQKVRDLTDENDKLIARLRSTLASGDRAGAAIHLAAMQETASKNGFNRLANVITKLEDRIYQESEMVLNLAVDLIATENKKLFVAIERLESPDIRKDFNMDSPSAALLHTRFVNAFSL